MTQSSLFALSARGCAPSEAFSLRIFVSAAWELHPALTAERITACARLLTRGRTDGLAVAGTWTGDDA